ncbi:MAG: hypothetical protein A2036_01290 [Omnitrophica bacterium GWA2_50_21]|nr:MAG: hypothetical protein A2036_01290 [Omnitrophica bacterium GWA2_50_21]
MSKALSLVLIIALMAVAPWYYGLTLPLHQYAAEAILFTLALVHIISRPKTGLDIWIAVILPLGLALVVFSAVPYDSLNSFLRLLAGIFLYIMVRDLSASRARILSVLWAGFGAGCFYAGYGLLQQYSGIDHAYWYQPDYLASRYVNSGHFAGFLLFPIWFAMALFFSSKNLAIRLLLMCGLALLLWVLILTRSRTVWITLVAGLIIFLFILRPKISYKLSFVILLTAAAAMLSVLFYKLGGIEQIKQRFMDLSEGNYFSLYQRLDIWKSSLSAMAERPWGWGMGSFRYVFPRFRMASDRFLIDYAHNEILQVGVELGVLGVLYLLGFAAKYWHTSIRVIRENSGDAQDKVFIASFISLSFCLFAASMTDFPLHIFASGLWFALALGLYDSKSFQKQIHFNRFFIAPAIVILVLFTSAQLYAQALHERGRNEAKNLMLDKAEVLFKKSIRFMPWDPDFHGSLARLYDQRHGLVTDSEKKNQFRQQAIHEYEKEVSLRPELAEPYVLLSLLLEELGDRDSADANFKTALFLEPFNEAVLLQYAYFSLRLGNVNSAIESFERFWKIRNYLEGPEVDPKFILNACYKITNDYNLLQRVVQPDWSGRYSLAMKMAEELRWEESEKEFDRSMVLAKKALPYPIYWENLGRQIAQLYVAKGRHVEAFRIYQAASKEYLNDDDLYRKIQSEMNQIKNQINSAGS